MTRILATVFALAGLIAATTRADDKPAIDAKTNEVLKKLGELYKDAKSLHTEMSIDVVFESDGQEQRKVNVKGTIDIKRPNQFALRTVVNKDPNMGPDFICDGKNLVIFGKRMKQYTETKAPAKMEDIGRALMPLQHMNTGMLFQNVLADDPAALLLDGVTEGKFVGTEKVGDKETNHLKFKQPRLEWELWVAAEGKPFVLKARTESERSDGKIVTVETYSKWKVNENPEKDPFTFKAPEGVQKVDQLGGARTDK